MAVRAARRPTRRSSPECGCGRGAELWINPDLDQGFGIGNTHGAAGYASAEAYKLSADYPYVRVSRAFVTIDLGGETQKVDADINQFAGSHTANRLVLWIGRFSIADVFDTNRYANNAKIDFLNWSLVNAGTFDYAADGWGYTYGTAAEWYQGRWTVRGGVFDLSVTPTDGNSPFGLDLDLTFKQFQMVGELEERHEMWGQPGKIKVTSFLSRGRAAHFSDAIALSQATGMPADSTLVRNYTSRWGMSLNMEQQLTETLCSRAPAGPMAMSNRGISPISTALYQAASRSPADNGAGPTIRSALPVSSTAFPACTKPF